jgi:rhomboid protease GluP
VTSEDARIVAERFAEQTLAEETRFRNANRGPPVRPTTIAIIAACVAMYVVQLALTDGSEASLLAVGALEGRWVRAGHLEMLLSYAFLHGGILHIVMNMSALYSVGSVLESIVGSKRTLVVFTLAVLGGGIALFVMKPNQLVVGASAGIFGVMTALYGISLRGSDLPALARTRLRKGIGTTLVLNLFISLLPNVSLLGHAGGALVGVVLGASGVLTRGVRLPWRDAPDASVEQRMNGAFTIAAIVCAIALAGSVAVALARGQWLRS